MPKEGSRSTTINEEIYEKVKNKADQEKRTVANMIEVLLEKALELEE